MVYNVDETNAMICGKIRKLIEEKGMTHQEIADAIGVSRQTISNWVSGNKTPRMDKFDKICEVLGVERGAILSDSTIEEYYENKKSAEIAQYI